MRSQEADYQPHVSAQDPELSVHENINQIILAEDMGSQSTRRRLEMPLGNSQGTNKRGNLNLESIDTSSVTGDREFNGDNHENACTVLDPADVSRTLSALQDASGENDLGLNCSAILNSQVAL